MRGFLWKSCLVFALLLLIGAAGFAQGLEQSFREIEKQFRNGDYDMKQVEAACLDLLKTHTSKEDTGRIYAQIPILYNTSYGPRSDAGRSALGAGDVVKYCGKAVEYPLDSLIKAKVYAAWGGRTGPATACMGFGGVCEGAAGGRDSIIERAWLPGRERDSGEDAGLQEAGSDPPGT